MSFQQLTHEGGLPIADPSAADNIGTISVSVFKGAATFRGRGYDGRISALSEGVLDEKALKKVRISTLADLDVETDCETPYRGWWGKQ